MECWTAINGMLPKAATGYYFGLPWTLEINAKEGYVRPI
jgi:hypothetical protein